MRYSVLMSLYCKEQPSFLEKSIASMVAQTFPPSEFVIVKDGLLGEELDEVIERYCKEFPKLFKIITKMENEGLGLALRDGVIACSNEWIARMDSDDISDLQRCEKQIHILNQHPEIDMIGTTYYEFFDSMKQKVLRCAPSNHEELVLYLHKRNPFGHDSLMYRRSKVLEAGNYRDMLRFEDYDLWIRMAMKNCVFHNMQEPLLYVRGNQDYYNRRGGFAYLKSNLHFFDEYRKAGFFSTKDCVLSLVPRIIVCLIPGPIRTFIYRKYLRQV